MSKITNDEAYDTLGLLRGSSSPSRNDLKRFRMSGKTTSFNDLMEKERAYAKLMKSNYISLDCRNLYGPDVNLSNSKSVINKYRELMRTSNFKSRNDSKIILNCSENFQRNNTINRSNVKNYLKESGIKIM